MGASSSTQRRILDKSSYSDILGEFGLPNSTLTYFLNVIFPPLKCSSLRHLWDLMGVGKITKIIVREVIEKQLLRKKGETQPTFSRTKKHTLWQHQKYMGHMDSQDIYINFLMRYNKCSMK